MSESEHEQELLKALDKLVEEKTFNLDAVKKVEKVRVKAELLASELAVTRTELATQCKCVFDLKQERMKLEKQVEAHKECEDNLVGREFKITELEKSSAVAKAESALAIKMFDTIFKNVTVRRNISRMVSKTDPSGYTTQAPESEDVDETEE